MGRDGIGEAVTIILRPDQQQLKSDIYSAWNNGARVVMGVLPTGGGKCLGKDTPVLMFDGTIKPVQNIKLGDAVMGPDGGPRLVMEICSGIDRLFRVVPKKGDAYIVNSKHILSLRRTNEKRNPIYDCQKRAGEIVNISIDEYLNQSKYFKHIHKGWRTGVDFCQKHLPIDPYFVGLWLGDGTSRNTAITNMDEEIFSYLKEFASLNNLSMRTEQKADNKAKTIHLRDYSYRKKRNIIHQFLAENNLIENKHVPHYYKTSSRKDRLNLLAGIIDADGHYTKKGFDINLKSEKLLDDVIYVARSLGFSAYKVENEKTCVNNGKASI